GSRDQREDGSDRLCKTLRGARRIPRAEWETRRDYTRRQEPERTERRPGQRARDEAVREERDQPSLLQCDGEDGENRNRAGDEACRRLVDRIREGEHAAHRFKKDSE